MPVDVADFYLGLQSNSDPLKRKRGRIGKAKNLEEPEFSLLNEDSERFFNAAYAT